MSEQTAESDQVLVTPLRPYRPGAPLVAVHESEWEDAENAFAQVPELEDALANCNAYARRLENALLEVRALHSGRHTCTTGDGRGWFMWDAKEDCTTVRLLPDLDSATLPGLPTPAPEDRAGGVGS